MYGLVSSFISRAEPLEEQFIFDPMSTVGLVCTLKTLDYKIGLQRRKISLHPPGSGAKRLAAGDNRDRSAEYIRPAIISCVLIYPPMQNQALRRIYQSLVEALAKNLDYYNRESKEHGNDPLKPTDKIVQIYTQVIEIVNGALELGSCKDKIIKTLAYDETLCTEIKNRGVWQKKDIVSLDETLQSIFKEQSEERKTTHLQAIKSMRDKKLEVFEPIVTSFLADQKVTALQMRDGQSMKDSIPFDDDDELFSFSPREKELLIPELSSSDGKKTDQKVGGDPDAFKPYNPFDPCYQYTNKN